MTGPRPEVLISESDIRARVGELAREISADYAAAGELYLVGILRGAFIFLADLARELTVPQRVDFIALSHYGGASDPSGAVRLIMDLRVPLRDQHVLIIEDIVDSGYTLSYLLRTIKAREPASIRTCALLQKPDRLKVPAPIDYLGFTIPDEWVVGYGLDYADRYRTLPYIGVLDPAEL